jgi:DNA-binding MarR family transcriptional regulator
MTDHRNFGFLLKDLSRRYVTRFEARAEAIALTLPQCKALVRLEKSEGASQKELAQLADVDAMSMVRIVDHMERDRLIERRLDPADRRARRLYLTDKGRALLEEIWRLAEATREEAFAGIERADRDRFMDLLEHMHANVCALEGRRIDAMPSARVGPIEATASKRAGRRGAR